MTKRAAEQGSELVRRLLAFARRQKLEPQAVDLEKVLRDLVWDLLTHTLGGLVNIEWKSSDKSWNAFADQAQLELALVNLIMMRDAMPWVALSPSELRTASWRTKIGPAWLAATMCSFRLETRAPGSLQTGLRR